jgi:type I restriction enzyme S subunit
MSAEQLLKHFDQICEAPDALSQLRVFVFDLAVRGKIVAQDAEDEPASLLLKRIQDGKNALPDPKQKTPHRRLHVDTGDDPFALPFGWIWTTVNDLSLRIHYGYTASASESSKDVRMLRITDIQNGAVDWNAVPGCEIGSEQVAQYLLGNGDFLIARTGGTIGKTFLIRGAIPKSVFASYLIRIQFSPLICIEYLRTFFESTLYWTQLREGARGAGQPNVNSRTLAQLKVPLPPLGEQKRIVSGTDKMLAVCDQMGAAEQRQERRRDRLVAVSLDLLTTSESGVNSGLSSHKDAAPLYLNHLPRLTARPEHVSRLRRILYEIAIQGRLVKSDDRDVPVSALLQQIDTEHQRLLTQGKARPGRSVGLPPEQCIPFRLPDHWIWIFLGRVVHSADSGWSPVCESFPRSGSNWGVVKVSAVSWDEFREDENKQLREGVQPRLDARIREGDFLISRANTAELVARCVVVRSEPNNLMMSDKIVRLKLSSGVHPDFLRFVINSTQYARAYFAKEASGTSPSMKNVSREVIYGLPIPLAPVEEQQRIVSTIRRLMGLCDELERSLESGSRQRHALLKSTILAVLGSKKVAAHVSI